MKVNSWKLVFLTALLASFLFYAFLSSAQQLPSEIADPAISNLPVFLNNESAGSSTSRTILATKLRSILKQREKTGTFRANSYEVENRVILRADPRLSMLDVGRIAESMQSAGAEVMLRGDNRCKEGSEAEIKPNPLLLVISNKKLSFDESVDFADAEDCWIPALITLSSKPVSLKIERVTRTGFEIGANGSYFFNERMPDYGVSIDLHTNSNIVDFSHSFNGPVSNFDANTAVRSNTNYGANRSLADIAVRQKPVEFASLAKEINRWVEQRLAERETDEKNRVESLRKSGISPDSNEKDESPLELSIIVSEKAAFSSLLPFLNELRGPKIALLITVRTSTAVRANR